MSITTGTRRVRFEDPFSLIPRTLAKIYTWWRVVTYPFASLGTNLHIHPPCRLSRNAATRIDLGNFVTINRDSWLNVIHDGKIIVGNNSSIGLRNILSAKNVIQIENDVMLAASVLIQDHNHAYEDVTLPISVQGETAGGTIRIEQGCWIGQGAAIVCNEGELVIGRNSVVGSNALVTKSVPPYSVVVGNPARLARRFDPSTGTWTGGEAGRRTAIESNR
jgi:acetyltransferase-like isoleucine patch superfamily enzyme